MNKLDPKAVWFFFFRDIWSIIPLLLFIWIIILPMIDQVGENPFGPLTQRFFGIAIVIVILGIIFSFGWAYLQYHFYRYELTERAFKKEYGVIWKKYVSIPYTRIQNVDIYRGLLARILGVSDLNIQTAGMSMGGRYGAFSEGRLPALSKKEAEQIRELLLNKIDAPDNHQGGLAGDV